MIRRPAWLAGGRVWLIAIVLLAALLRIAAIAYTHGTQAAPEENRLIARNLATGRGFTFTEFGVTGPTAIRGPAYPMLLAIIGPDRVGLILAINVFAGAASVLAAASLTSRLLSPLPGYRERESELSSSQTPPPTRAVWIAAILFAVWPTQLYAATLTQGLSIAVFLTLAPLTLAWRRTPPALIAAGLLAGLAALTEPVLALPLLLSALVLGWRDRTMSWHWPDAALFIGTALVLIAPWLYRNAVVFGGPIPITSNFWRDAFLGNGGMPPEQRPLKPRPVADGESPVSMTPIEMLSPRDFDRLKRPEPERTHVFRAWTLDALKQNPGEYARRCWRRLLLTTFGQIEHRYSASWLMPTFLVLVASASTILLSSHRSGLRPLVIVFGLGLLLPMIAVRSEARMIALLDLPVLLACAGTYLPETPIRSLASTATQIAARNSVPYGDNV